MSTASPDRPATPATPGDPDPPPAIVPGEILLSPHPVRIDDGPAATLFVVNRGDRPVQVGSHFHFAETNPALAFDRGVAWGMRLAVPAGTSVRFEPGLERQVGLVALAGARRVPGLRGLVSGPLDAPPDAEPDALAGALADAEPDAPPDALAADAPPDADA